MNLPILETKGRTMGSKTLLRKSRLRRWPSSSSTMRNAISASCARAALTHLRSKALEGSGSRVEVAYWTVIFNFAGFGLARLPLSGVPGELLLSFIFLIGIDNSLHQRMPHHIL